MSTTKTMKCHECGTNFDVIISEYNRQIRKGRPEYRFFCGLSCSMKRNNKEFKMNTTPPPPQWGNDYGKNGKKGEHTQLLNKCRQRTRKRGKLMDIDEAYLVALWEEQGGKCAYTNIEMMKKSKHKMPHTASLDRIDSSIGYMKGNVQFVCYSINTAKNDFDEKTFRSFMSALIEANYSTT